MPVAILVAEACSIAWREIGSFAAADWLGYALVAALLLAVILLSGAATRPQPLVLGGLAALVAFAGWEAVSLTWSPSPSAARDDALLVMFYVVALAVALTTIRGDAERAVAAGVVVAAICAVAVATAVDLLVSAHPGDLYIDGRLDFPISYPNAQAAMFLVAFWPALALAARQAAPIALRAAALGGATALVAGWLLAQSKGGGLGLAFSVIVFFAVCPSRLRALVHALVPAVLAGATIKPLTEPFRASQGALDHAIRVAGATTLGVAAGGAALGAVLALVDRRDAVPARVQRLGGYVAVAALVAAIVAGVGAFFVTVDRPGHYVQQKWETFKRLPPKQQAGSTHLLTLGSNRYDFWRVALRTFADHPAAGVGARGFQAIYLQERRSTESPVRAHSLELDTLAETGVVGFVLLALGLGLPVALVAARARRSLASSALLAAAAYWVVHATVDWIWTIPAATLPFVLLLGIGAARDDPRPLGGRAAVAGGVAAVALALLAFAPPWLSARFTTAAYTHPQAAGRDLRWARRLDPLSLDPLQAEADLASTAPGRIAALRRAVAKEPRRADLHYQLGLVYRAAGRRREARAELGAARRLAPRDPDIALAFRQVSS